MSYRLSVAILAGGQSKRMGCNKALLPLPPSGDSMVRTIALRVSSLTDDLMIIGPPLPGIADLAVRTIPDLGASSGPLTGVATALAAARHQTCMIVACDLPLLQTAMLEYLCQISAELDVDAVVPRRCSPITSAAERTWQPLLAIYHLRCLPTIAHLLADDRHRVQDLCDSIRIHPVPESELRRFDPDLRSFINVNDPAAYHQICDFLTGTAGTASLYNRLLAER